MPHKIPLHTEIFDHASLTARVDHWLNQLNLAQFVQKHHFKYFPFFIHTLSGAFLSGAIRYSIKKRLPGLSTDSQSNLL